MNTITTPAAATTLASRAMLATLSVSNWTGHRLDRVVSDEIAEAKEAKAGAGRYIKHLLPSDALGDLKAIGGSARAEHYNLTMPWDDGMYRLLPVDVYDRYTEKMEAYRDQRMDAVATLLRQYDDHIGRARIMLGRMFDASDYPSPDALAARFRLEFSFMPVPDEKHFIADLPADEADRIRSDIEDQIAGRIKGTVVHLHRRLADVVNDVSTRLDTDDEGKPHIFRDSLVERLNETVEIIPHLNITGDPEIDAMCRRLAEAIEGVSPNNLRLKNKAFNADKYRRVKGEVDDLAARFSGYFGTPEAAAGGDDE